MNVYDFKLTTDDFSHTAGGINTAYVFWMCRVSVITKQESCKKDKTKIN